MMGSGTMTASEVTSSEATCFDSLPHELLDKIAEQVSDASSLAGLAATSTVLLAATAAPLAQAAERRRLRVSAAGARNLEVFSTGSYQNLEALADHVQLAPVQFRRPRLSARDLEYFDTDEFM